MDNNGLVQFIPWIGTRRLWKVNGIMIGVNVVDIKMVFGRVDLRIVPVDGSGHVWVNASSLEAA